MIRRTITVEDPLNRAINCMRAALLEKHDIDLGFTSVMNMLALVGYRKFTANDLNDEDWEIIRSHVFNLRELRTEAVFDQARDEWLRNELPKLLAGACKK